MKKISTIIFLMLCVMTTQKAVAFNYAAIPDSIAPDPEDEDYYLDTIAKNPKRLAEGQNAIDYSLETRYRPQGEEFTKKWYDHMFLQAGMGFLKIVPASDDYKLNNIISANLGIGKTFAKYHTARLALTLGSGYQGSKHFYMLQGSADYLFNMTGFSKGYDPSRPFEMSLLLGGGLMYTKMKNKPTYLSPEVHAGMQFKFVGGPYGHFTVEPFVGLTRDKMDYSPNNWRQYDFFYGVNVNLMHNFFNNYAPRQRNDSLRYNPWFVEAGMGPAVVKRNGGAGIRETMGLEMSWSVGKWISPVLGFKLSAFMASNTMYKSSRNKQEKNHYTAYCGGNIEGLVNPFGFSKRFRWDAPFGAYLFAGLGYGSVQTNTTGGHGARTYFESVTAGAHLFATIDKDLQFFVEPRFARNLHNHHSRSDKNVAVLFGLTANTRSAKYRHRHLFDLNNEEESDALPITAGLSFTVPVMMMQTSAYAAKGFSYGFKAFGQYRFTPVSAARLSIDFLSLSRATESPYIEQYTQKDQTVSRSRNGVMNRRHGLLIATANYSMDVCRLLSGNQGPRFFNAELYFGPGAAFYLSESASPLSDMKIAEGHTVKGNVHHKFKTCFAFTGGVKLSHNFSHNWGVYLEPSLHAVAKLKMAGIQTISFVDNRMQLIPSVSLGAQYTL